MPRLSSSPKKRSKGSAVSGQRTPGVATARSASRMPAIESGTPVSRAPERAGAETPLEVRADERFAAAPHRPAVDLAGEVDPQAVAVVGLAAGSRLIAAQGEQHLARRDAIDSRLALGEAELDQEADFLHEGRLERHLEARAGEARERTREHRHLGVQGVDGAHPADRRREVDLLLAAAWRHGVRPACLDDVGLERELVEHGVERVGNGERSPGGGRSAIETADAHVRLVHGVELARQEAGHGVGDSRRRAHAEERRHARRDECVVELELLLAAVVKTAQVAVRHPRRERRAHDREIPVVGDAVEYRIVPGEKPRRRRLVAHVHRRRALVGILCRHLPEVGDRDFGRRRELMEIPPHHFGHRSGSPEESELHQSSSSSRVMVAVSRSTSFSVSSRMSSTSSIRASEMLSAGSMRTTRELVSVPATSTPRLKRLATTL